MTEPLLPDFIIIGAMKCGTTSLYRYMSIHPAVEMSREKETDFFVAEKNWNLGLDWYSGQFSSKTKIRGEASPNYTKSRDFPGVAARMASVVPQARLIYIVRDPVSRAVSQYRHGFIMGDLAGGLDQFADSHEYKHILDASHYARQLQEYRAHFSEDQILVLDFDRLVSDPQAVLDQVCDHIGAPRHLFPDLGAQNDSAELSKVPAPILRFAQGRLGRRLAGLVSRDTRDRLRRLLARGRQRTADKFPPELIDRMRHDLGEDAALFREMTGQTFAGWSI